MTAQARFLSTVVLCLLAVMLTGRAQAQYYAILKSFSPGAVNGVTGNYTNADGTDPVAEVIVSGQTLYGVASGGGTNGSGTVFKLNFDGTGFAVLHHFAPGRVNASSVFTNADGQSPQGRLFLQNDMLYGTTAYGGPNGNGTIFKVNTNGSNFQMLRNLQGSTDGGTPYTGLLLPDPNVVIGEGNLGGTGVGLGTLYRMDTNGNNFTVLHTFSSTQPNGIQPWGTLVQSGTNVYGTTYAGGTNLTGTIFKVSTNGNGFQVLKSFSALTASTNGDGAFPRAGLIVSGSQLYGTTFFGGVYSNGVVFRINTDGSGFTNIHSLAVTTTSFGGAQYNLEGANPAARLVLAGSTLYGTTRNGSDAEGNIFSVNTDGSDYYYLRGFGATIPYDGNTCMAGLTVSGAMLFGTTEFGGTNDTGTVFVYRWDNVPPVTIAHTGTNVILSWPTDTQANSNKFNFTLQSTPQLAPAPSWSTLTNPPAFNPYIGIGINVVTNSTTGTARFYRLSSY